MSDVLHAIQLYIFAIAPKFEKASGFPVRAFAILP
ncbi:kynurenine formamidase [Amphibacillus cookii]|nr:kynurenine formamidase [Amphibacillus cookii]